MKIDCFDSQIITSLFLIKKEWGLHRGILTSRIYSACHQVCYHCYLFLCNGEKLTNFLKAKYSVHLRPVGAQQRVVMLVCEGTIDDYSMDCTVDMNAQWEDLAAILNLSWIRGSSLGGQDRTHVCGFSYSSPFYFCRGVYFKRGSFLSIFRSGLCVIFLHQKLFLNFRLQLNSPYL